MKLRTQTANTIKHIGQRNILLGTIILTLAGFITRVIGFFYKIFLSKVMGSEWLGIYQLIFQSMVCIYNLCNRDSNLYF